MREKLGACGGYSWTTKVFQNPGVEKNKEEEQGQKKEEDKEDRK